MSGRIVVTGASGFLGRHLCRDLLAAGRNVLGVARRPLPDMPSVQVTDYRDTPGGDILIHLAERSDRGAALVAGEDHVAEVTSTLQVLLDGRFGRLLYASSGMVYGDAEASPRKVGDPTPARDPYALGKLSSEEQVTAAGGVALRLANLIGPGMAGGTVVSTILEQIPGSAPLRLRDGGPVRDFLWIDDAVAGVIALLDRASAGVYNLGTGRGVAIRQLARMALEAAGEAERTLEETAPNGRCSNLVLDVAATTRATGWYPVTTVDAGMARLIAGRLAETQGGG
ncbi:NAD-dependent epimerase/dehydratase family protein [Algihabitans albus]|uniref:NAD-dependent epimerase/dehydratase family protein n=1 Tax=Algihabitans albus TaxID=2164067 RepID=UPI000E5D6124|nr:NAD(P)-dependent oxidoreductase [Algihabitans albus]